MTRLKKAPIQAGRGEENVTSRDNESSVSAIDTAVSANLTFFRNDARSTILVVAMSLYYGLREGTDRENNPTVMGFYKSAGHSWVQSDAVPWCSAFMCAVMEACGLDNPKTLRARNWLDWGESIDEADARTGDVVVLKRGAGGGHVGIVVRIAHGGVWVLGGNQTDRVRVSWYPASRVLGYRTVSTG